MRPGLSCATARTCVEELDDVAPILILFRGWAGMTSDPARIVVEAICSDCGERFTMTADEVSWYDEREIARPMRCAACRRQGWRRVVAERPDQREARP